MRLVDQSLLIQFSGLQADVRAIGEAAMAEDFEEARFRTRLVIDTATDLRMQGVVLAALVVAAALSDRGAPLPGYGAAILGLAKTIHAPSVRMAVPLHTVTFAQMTQASV